MRRVADELGTGAASLYWHVGSKDGLLDLVFDRVIGEQQIPDPDPERWKEQLKEVARAQRDASIRHPYIVRISIGRIPMGPNALRYSERVLAILRAGGVPPRLAVQGQHLLISAVNGFTLDETGVADPGSGPPLDQAGGKTRRTWRVTTWPRSPPPDSRTWSSWPTSTRWPIPASGSSFCWISSSTAWPATRAIRPNPARTAAPNNSGRAAGSGPPPAAGQQHAARAPLSSAASAVINLPGGTTGA